LDSAQLNLAVLYQSGQPGVPKNVPEAMKYLRMAAQQLNPRAQFNLAQIYGNGDDGVPQDLPRSLMWFSAAASRLIGNEQQIARENMAEISRAMTPAQRTEAQALARQCQADFSKCE
jgi:TPR repeat protein